MYKLALMNRFIKKIDRIHPKGTSITNDELMVVAREAIEAQNKVEDIWTVKNTKNFVPLDEVTFGDCKSDVSVSVEPIHLVDTATDQEYLSDKDVNKLKRSQKQHQKQEEERADEDRQVRVQDKFFGGDVEGLGSLE